MGIVKNQTVKGIIFTYLGAFIGFITTGILQPKLLTQEQVGLVGILSDLSVTFAILASLGFSATIRYFPYFRNEARKHNGYLFLASIVSLVGFLLVCVIIIVCKGIIVNQDVQQSTLFSDYYIYLIPLTLFVLYFNVFELFARVNYETVAARLLREFVKRLLVLVVFMFLLFKLIGFNQFMPLWLLANIIPTIILFWWITRMKSFSLRPDFSLLNKDMRKKLANISVFALLTGSAPVIISMIDKFMVNQLYGLSMTGIYAISIFFGNFIMMPARSLNSVALPIVADAWKSNDIQTIDLLYKKSSINQLFIALLLFIGIWANIDNIFAYIPDYSSGRYVIFFIALYSVLDMSTGISGVIISTSRYYRYDAVFYFSLIAFTIGANLVFIPLYGITGAAMATALTYFIFKLFRYLFILRKFNIQPFTWNSLILVAVAASVYYISTLIPAFASFIVDTLVRSIFIGILYVAVCYFLNISADINGVINSFFRKFRR